MQLKSKTVGASLAAACSLIGITGKANAADAADTTFDTAILYYGENDGRVKDVSLRVQGTHAFDEDHSLSGTFTFDSLTGASPSGAIKSDQVQTFTTPSGRSTTRSTANKIPLDDTFHDKRFALNLGYTLPVLSASRLQVGADGSAEHDYTHFGVNGRWETDFNQKNTTVYGAAAYAADTVNPEGGVPVAFSLQSAQAREKDQRSKNVTDLLVGAAQVISRRSLLETAISYSKASGYLTDPYKVVSVVDNTGRPTSTRFERRPESRTKKSVFIEWRYAFDRDSVATNYRYMTDDWGVTSHTIEARYRFNFSKQRYFEPVVRYYTQTAADFYRTVLTQVPGTTSYATADYRLADMNTVSLGAKYAWITANNNEYSVRAMMYRQTADESAGSRIGVLANLGELVPQTNAIMVQFGVKFGWPF